MEKKEKKAKPSSKKKKIEEDARVIFELVRRAHMGDASGVRSILTNPENDKKFDLVSGTAAEALTKACEAGHEPVVRILLEHGADIRYQNCKTLRKACQAVKIPMARFLLQSGADPNAKAEFTEFTSLHYAVRAGSLELVQLLHETGAMLDEPCHAENCGTYNGWAALHFAADLGYTEIVRYLFERGATCDLPNAYGETALSIAAEAGRFDIVKYLAWNGANIHAKRRELTVVQWAIYRARPDIVQFLVSQGADPELKNTCSWFPNKIMLKDLIAQEYSTPVHKEIDLAIYRGSQQLRTRAAVRRILKEYQWYGDLPDSDAPAAPSGYDPMSAFDSGGAAAAAAAAASAGAPEVRNFPEEVVECLLSYVF